jgi:hypothetical protein
METCGDAEGWPAFEKMPDTPRYGELMLDITFAPKKKL